MALPATGNTITMTQIFNHFSAAGAYSIGNLGSYIGISSGTTLSMSAGFGGR